MSHQQQQQRHHPYQRHHHHHHHGDNTTTTATPIDVITLDSDSDSNNNNHNHHDGGAHYCPLRPTTSKAAASSSAFSSSSTSARQSRSPAAAAATTIVDRDYCVLIAEYTRDELERTRRYEQQQSEQREQQQQQQLADAQVLTTRVMNAYSALEERYETCTAQLAESREESEGWRDDLGRFGRRQYEERRAATLQQTANAATIAALGRELEDARHTIVRHTIAQRNNNKNNMMCPVCLETYVDLAAASN